MAVQGKAREVPYRRAMRQGVWLGWATIAGTMVTLQIKDYNFFGSTPRWDVLIPLAATAALGLAWMLLYHRRGGTPPAAPGRKVSRPLLPAVLPRVPGHFGFARCIRVTLTVLYLFTMATLSVAPPDPAHDPVAWLTQAGGITRPLPITGLGPVTKVEKREGRSVRAYWQSDISVEVPYSSGTRTVRLDAQLMRERPQVGDTVEILYAPDRPGLGIVRDPQEPLDWEQSGGMVYFFIAIGLAVAGIISIIFRPWVTADRTAPLQNCAGRPEHVAALRCRVVGAVATKDSRLWDRSDTPDTYLRLVTATGPTHEIDVVVPAHTDARDPGMDLAGQQGWLFWERTRRGPDREPYALAFVTDADELLWCATPLGHVVDHLERHPNRRMAEPAPQRTVREVRYSRYRPEIHPRVALLLGLAVFVSLPMLIQSRTNGIQDFVQLSVLAATSIAIAITWHYGPLRASRPEVTHRSPADTETE
ncbi:hypothetical protein ACIQMV_39315 [Streptomyces sp. NPDC091412]|uniref:hypothetical protein n=1 Tax=Streptomyces sp. NPDC091412 TaxID=3366002 RepID=UPI003804389D